MRSLCSTRPDINHQLHCQVHVHQCFVCRRLMAMYSTFALNGKAMSYQLDLTTYFTSKADRNSTSRVQINKSCRLPPFRLLRSPVFDPAGPATSFFILHSSIQSFHLISSKSGPAMHYASSFLFELMHTLFLPQTKERTRQRHDHAACSGSNSETCCP